MSVVDRSESIQERQKGEAFMTEPDAALRRFIGHLIIGDAITITIEYEYAKLIRHLRNRAIVRNFRSLDKQAGKITFEEEQEEFVHRLVVRKPELTEDAFIGQPETINIVWSTDGLEEEVNRIIADRVLPDEKERLPNYFEQLAEECMEHLVRLNLIAGVSRLMQRSLDDAVISQRLLEPIKAAIFDEGERIPRFGLARATRKNKSGVGPKYAMNSNVFIRFGQQYDRILNVVDAGKGIIGLARAVYDSNLYKSRYKTIGDAYRDEGVEVPKEVIDWILDNTSSKRMPTNAAVALELAACESIPGYTSRGLSTNTLKQYLKRSDNLLGIKRKKKSTSSKNTAESITIS